MGRFTTGVTLLTAVALLWAGVANSSTRRPHPPAARAEVLRQYSSNGYVLGFDSGGYYVSNGTYALRVRFEHGEAITPATDDAEQNASEDAKAAALGRLSYAGLWKGISVTYDAPSGAIARTTWPLEPGADPAVIRLVYNRPVTLANDRSLSIAFETGALLM